MAQIPLDVIRHILVYVQELDIDIRREYGVYSKIKMEPFEKLNIGYAKYEKISEKFIRVTMFNIHALTTRKAERIADDYWDIELTDNREHISFYIVKFQYRPNKYYRGSYDYNTSFYDYNQ